MILQGDPKRPVEFDSINSLPGQGYRKKYLEFDNKINISK